MTRTILIDPLSKEDESFLKLKYRNLSHSIYSLAKSYGAFFGDDRHFMDDCEALISNSLNPPANKDETSNVIQQTKGKTK